MRTYDPFAQILANPPLQCYWIASLLTDICKQKARLTTTGRASCWVTGRHGLSSLVSPWPAETIRRRCLGSGPV